jgi:hypothetical protein
MLAGKEQDNHQERLSVMMNACPGGGLDNENAPQSDVSMPKHQNAVRSLVSAPSLGQTARVVQSGSAATAELVDPALTLVVGAHRR